MKENNLRIIKRDGIEVDFDKSKIYNAIMKAMKYGSGIVKENIAQTIADDIEHYYILNRERVTVLGVESEVYHKLVDCGEVQTAKAYEGYRAVQTFKRQINTSDKDILGLIYGTNETSINENSNKNAQCASTQRDLIAGEVSKDIARRKLIPAHITQAHDDGLIHWHDMDYTIQQIFNCMLVDLDNMLQHGTVINGKMVEKPNSFKTACNIATQIMAQVASGQYGGQTCSITHLAPFVRISYENYKKTIKKEGIDNNIIYTDEQIRNIAQSRVKKEIEDGVQTMMYQINTLATSNGQSPFVSLFMYLNEDTEYTEEIALIIEEILKQRYQGIKNEKGVYISPAFPKLLYVLDENNIHTYSKYRYLTELAIKCVSKRMMPDFISAKKMKEHYEGNVFPCMGCRSWLSIWRYKDGKPKFYGRFNMGVVSLSLLDVALSSKGDEKVMWNILNDRLALCKEALLLRYKFLKGASPNISPIHWKYGAVTRLDSNDSIDHLLENGYATISLGYVGLYEMVKYMTGESHTSKKGEQLAIKVMKKLREACDAWKAETGLGFGLYGSPAESLIYKFARTARKRFGVIKGITDREYITNSYHVHVTEEIDAFSKLQFEAQFQKISSGGCISYVEVPNMAHNLEALTQVVEYMYEHIQYAEINTKSDYCQCCGYDGEILINDDLEWECPNCHNKDRNKMNITRRTCGYLGENPFNKGKTQEMKQRVTHL